MKKEKRKSKDFKISRVKMSTAVQVLFALEVMECTANGRRAPFPYLGALRLRSATRAGDGCCQGKKKGKGKRKKERLKTLRNQESRYLKHRIELIGNK